MSVADEVIVEIRRVPKSDIYGFIELNCLYFHTTLYNIFIFLFRNKKLLIREIHLPSGYSQW
jgi:hypothetical protein